MNRITQCFAELSRAGRKGFIAYLGAGDPDLAATRDLAWALAGAGVDILELGVPFSDPLADGLVNQLAAQRGLQSGTTPGGVLAAVHAIRARSPIPIVLYLYFNLLHRYGLGRFIAEGAAAGVDGLLVLDLPPEEAAGYEAEMKQAGLCAIYLVAPTTPEARVSYIVRRATGFIYYVSREGVTGMQSKVSESIGGMISLIRKYTPLPIAVGFGVSNAAQARLIAEQADAVVVGSAIVDQIARHGGKPGLPEAIAGFVRPLVDAVKGVRAQP